MAGLQKHVITVGHLDDTIGEGTIICGSRSARERRFNELEFLSRRVTVLFGLPSHLGIPSRRRERSR